MNPPTHSNILAWRIPWTNEPGGYGPWGGKESDTTEQLTLSLFFQIQGDHVTHPRPQQASGQGRSLTLNPIGFP